MRLVNLLNIKYKYFNLLKKIKYKKNLIIIFRYNNQQYIILCHQSNL